MTLTKEQHFDIPGTLYKRKNRWWWKVQLPGEPRIKTRAIRQAGERFATTDCN